MASRPGSRPDLRVQKVAEAAGVNLRRIRASRVAEKELVRSDYILAMDNTNLQNLMDICPPEHQRKISLLLSHLSGHALDEVPDPYYGSVEGFEKVFQLIDAAVVALIPHIASQK